MCTPCRLEVEGYKRWFKTTVSWPLVVPLFGRMIPLTVMGENLVQGSGRVLV